MLLPQSCSTSKYSNADHGLAGVLKEILAPWDNERHDDNDLQTIEAPKLTTAKLSGEGIYEMTLNYPLRNAKKLHNLKVYGILVKKLDYHLLPALTHLTWDDGVSPEGQIMETIPPLANASRLKSLELGSYTSFEPGTISEIQRYCPR